MPLRGEPPLHQDSALALAEDLRPLLHRLMREMRREDLDLHATPLQALLLANVLKHPGIGVVELAQLEKLRGPTVSSHVKALEKLGLIVRGEPDPQDRRRIGLVVTENGRRVLVDLKQRRTDWLAERLAGVSPEARELLRAAIPVLAEILE
jgi:DNA-binding MarR family transcriptional regulator